MPSSMTHSYFAVDVYNKLDDKSKIKIEGNINNYKTYSLETSLFFFPINKL